MGAGVGYLGTRATRGAGAQEAKMPRSRAAWACLWGPHLAPRLRVGLATSRRGVRRANCGFRRDVGWAVRTAEGRDGLRTGRSWIAFG